MTRQIKLSCKNIRPFWRWLTLTWSDTHLGATSRLLAKPSSKTLSRNYFPGPNLQYKCGWRINTSSKLYYDPSKTSAFSTLKKLQAAAKQRNLGKKAGEIKSSLETHDAHKLHKPLRRRFPRNPYMLNNVLDVWECDLVRCSSSQ